MSSCSGRDFGRTSVGAPPDGRAGAARSSSVISSFVPALVLTALAAVAVLAPSAARAAFTPILPPSTDGEKSQKEIFDHIYGGSFVPVGLNYTNGSVFATRIQDTLDPPFSRDGAEVVTPLPLVDDGLSVRGSTNNITDQLWSADSVVATAQARFATYSNEFGYLDGTTGGSFNKLFWVSGGGFTVGGASNLDGLSNHIFRWGRDGDLGVLTSQNADNSDGLDHMVTYRIDTIGTKAQVVTTYLLFWEDSRFGVSAQSRTYDADFNDMVIEIKASRTVVPEPVALGALGLSGLTCLRRRRQVG